MSRLLLLDGHSLAYRAFFALPAENFSTSTGQHTNAVYGFTSMLINVLRDEQPTHVAVAFDVSRQTFRSEEYADYKATRSATPSEFSGQIPLVREVLDALRIRWVEVDGYEADDVIATLTTEATAQDMDVVICTGDRDAFQLVTDRVTLLYPVRGVSEVWRMTPAAVLDKYLVTPERYSDLAALVGETSDNLPGVPGVGPKTAAKWLGLYGDLQGVVAHADEIKGKAGESLREHLNDVLRNRRLNQLVRDLPLPVTVPELERQNWDREQVHTVFDSLEFRVLRDRLFEYLEAPQEEAEHGFDLDGVGARPRRGGRLARRARRAGRHRWACTSSAGGAAARATSPPWPWPPTATPRPTSTSSRARRQGRRARWATGSPTPTRPKVLHDAKGPLLALAARGWSLDGIATDTALAAYLVRPDQRSYDLADLVLRQLGRELRAETEDSGQGLLDFGDEGDAAARTRWCGPAPCSTSPAALADQLEATGGTVAPAGRRAAARARARRHGAHRHRRRRRADDPARGRLRRRGARGPAGRLRRHRWRPDQPRLAQAAPDRSSSRRSACPRRGAPRPATRPTPTRSTTSSPRPSTRSSRRCCATATPRGCG